MDKLKINKRILIFLIIFIVLYATFTVLGTVASQLLIDTYFPSLNMNYIVQGVLILGFVMVFTEIIYIFREFFENYLELYYGNNLKKIVRDKYLKLNYYDLSKVESDKFITLMNNDTEELAKKYSLVIDLILNAVLTIVFTVFTMLYYNWLITIACFFMLFIYIYINKKITKRIDIGAHLEKKAIEDLNKGNKLIIDNFVSNKMQENNSKYFEKENSYFSNYRNKSFSLSKERLLLFVVNLLLTAVITTIIFGAGGILIVKNIPALGTMTLGKVVAIGLLFESLSNPIFNISRGLANRTKANVSKERINKFLSLDEEKIGGLDIKKINSISLKNISFGYDKDKYVLNNFSYSFNKSNFYIIKGESGKGKSTIIKLILGFIKSNKGNIFSNDLDLKDLDIKKYRKRVGYLSQNVELLSGISLKNNVVIKDNFQEDKFNRYKKIFELDKWIDTIPNKWDTIVSENLNVSGGQKQRLAIIKTFCSKKDVYILDEPENGLSDQLINKLYRVCAENAKESMVIMISHHTDFSNYNAHIIDLNELSN